MSARTKRSGPPAAIVGAAETNRIGFIKDLSHLGLNAEAALNALADAGLSPQDIDGVTCGYQDPAELATYLGIYPTWLDNTVVGGCSWLLHLRNAAAAIGAGYCRTVLIVHGESGRSRVGFGGWGEMAPGSLAGQFDIPYAFSGAVTRFTLPVLRYMKEYGICIEQMAEQVVFQREWAARNPRALKREPITVDEVLSAPMLAWPFTRPMVCMLMDGGAALVVTSAERAKDFPKPPVYLLGSGEAYEAGICGVGQMRNPIAPEYARISARLAFEQAGLAPSDINHLMIYDAFVHCVNYGLDALGFVGDGESAAFISDGHTRIGGSLPTNTNGGGLSYVHTGSYGMFLMQEAVRQLRGEAAAQVEGARFSACHGWGGYWSACATIILGNEIP